MTGSQNDKAFKNISMTINLVILQVVKSLVSLVKVTSCDETKEFADRILKDMRLLCPPVIQNTVSIFVNNEQID